MPTGASSPVIKHLLVSPPLYEVQDVLDFLRVTQFLFFKISVLDIWVSYSEPTAFGDSVALHDIESPMSID